MFCSSCWTSYSWIQPKSSRHPADLPLRACAAGPSGRCSSELVTRELAGSCGCGRAAGSGTGEGGLEVVALRVGEQRGEREGVLDGGVRALPVVGEHPVGGVAEDDHAAAVPAQQGRTVNSAHGWGSPPLGSSR